MNNSSTVLCRVFQLPEKFSGDFLFGGPRATCFYEIDFFHCDEKHFTNEIEKINLIEFIQSKQYYNNKYSYLVLSSSQECFIIPREPFTMTAY